MRLAVHRPVVLMRLRNKMVPSDDEHQLKFLVYTLERASELADETGDDTKCSPDFSDAASP